MKRVMIVKEENETIDNTTIYIEKATKLKSISFSIPFAINYLEKNKDFYNDFEAIIILAKRSEASYIDLCNLIRDKAGKNWIPLFIISESTNLSDKYDFFDADVDDYLQKPFDPIELIIRLKSLLRRKDRILKNSYPIKEINPKKTINLNNIEFTNIEYDIFIFLYQNYNNLFSSESILINALKSSTRSPEIIRTNIKNIRKKIESDTKKPEIIVNIPKRGYFLSKEKLEEKFPYLIYG